MATYQGHRSWNAWNVSLWINNDIGLYFFAKECLLAAKGNRREAAKRFMREGFQGKKTPDGARYNATCVAEAMEGMLE